MPENAYRMAHLHSHRAAGGLACPEREGLAQGTPAGETPRGRCCTRCGRVTARRDPDGFAWCGGDLSQT